MGYKNDFMNIKVRPTHSMIIFIGIGLSKLQQNFKFEQETDSLLSIYDSTK